MKHLESPMVQQRAIGRGRPRPPRRVCGESRSASVRRYKIHQIFLRDTFTNCTKLAQELEVGVRTLLRDIEVLRSQDFPIEYDPVRRAYFYSESVHNLPNIQITESELLALRVAVKAMAQNAAAPFSRQLARISRVLLAGMDDHDTPPTTVLDGAFSFYCVGVGVVEETVFRTISNAVARRCEIEFEYRKPSEVVGQTYRIRPYFVANRDSMFYMIGEDVATRRLKSFAMPRIIAPVRVLHRHFNRLKNMSVEKYFGNAFRIFTGDAIVHIRLRASKLAAPYIKERRWHPSQRITDLPTGEILLEMDLADVRDVRSWILRWGPDVEVLGPDPLRADIARLTLRTARLYDRDAGVGSSVLRRMSRAYLSTDKSGSEFADKETR